MNKSKKLLIVDGNSILNRAFYGIRPLTNSKGLNTHAVYGMINIISRQLNSIKPDYAAVAFDLKAPTFRHQMYDGYKAGRNPTPPDLISQFPDAKECLSLMGLKVLELPGYEADDIQGTVAKMAHLEEDTEGYILSGDRDLLQLIDEKVTVLLATNSDTKVMTPDAFREEYGIDSSAFVDMKALMGDSSDNIPGVAGVGPKTAKDLLVKFGSLDGVYENLNDASIRPKLREKLEAALARVVQSWGGGAIISRWSRVNEAKIICEHCGKMQYCELDEHTTEYCPCCGSQMLGGGMTV